MLLDWDIDPQSLSYEVGKLVQIEASVETKKVGGLWLGLMSAIVFACCPLLRPRKRDRGDELGLDWQANLVLR